MMSPQTLATVWAPAGLGMLVAATCSVARPGSASGAAPRRSAAPLRMQRRVARHQAAGPAPVEQEEPYAVVISRLRTGTHHAGARARARRHSLHDVRARSESAEQTPATAREHPPWPGTSRVPRNDAVRQAACSYLIPRSSDSLALAAAAAPRAPHDLAARRGALSLCRSLGSNKYDGVPIVESLGPGLARRVASRPA